ncbi:MAG: imidazole glycerol phosphate synthase subunit HisH [Clostridiales bacterium]|nr:imidazole glycerol phosphate synthase subunit HisH [Clostridiales bacterium]
MIAIIDYNVGNVKSVLNACKRLGVTAVLTNSADEIVAADGVILPGVGSFGVAMKNLEKLGLISVLREYKKPMLGICLGMQILFERGFEGGEFEGLGLIKGDVKLIPTEQKLPHMGWNTLEKRDGDVYFVHSYMADYNEHTLDYCLYGDVKIPAIVGRGNVLGCQFHPEKSGKIGEEILKEWVALV